MFRDFSRSIQILLQIHIHQIRNTIKHNVNGLKWTCRRKENEVGGCVFKLKHWLSFFRIQILKKVFAHDLFYTKSALPNSFWSWIIQFVSLISVGIATGIFMCVHKHAFLGQDIVITYGLLVTALVLEAFSFLETITSNYNIVQVGFKAGRRWRFLERIIQWLCHVVREKKKQKSFSHPVLSYGPVQCVKVLFS